jgi:hypothetical protein
VGCRSAEGLVVWDATLSFWRSHGSAGPSRREPVPCVTVNDPHSPRSVVPPSEQRLTGHETVRWWGVRRMPSAVRTAVQAVVIGGAALFLIVTARQNWRAMASTNVVVSWPPLLVASALTLGAFAFMVYTWCVSLRWWGQRPRYLAAVRIWSLSNLARFIPGTIWQFAGLAALAADEGVSPVAATAGVLMQQVVLLGTGLLLSILLAPQLLPGWTAAVPVWALIAGVIAGLGGLVIALPRIGQLVAPLARRWFGKELAWPAPHEAASAAYIAALVLPWLIYGVAFWLFGRALLGPDAPGLKLAASAFTVSYVAGILVVVAPGGLGVREASLVAALAPSLGAGRALILAVGSRMWLVALEMIGAAAIVLAYRRSTAEQPQAPTSGAS